MRPHLFLNNPRGEERKFDASRGFENRDDAEEPLPQAYRQQKERLNLSLSTFNKQIQERTEERTIEVPEHIDYVKIDFFIVFNNNDVFQTKTRFRNEFGLIPVAYTNFNQTVYFAIVDETRFRVFLALVHRFINSRDNIRPQGTEYAIVTLIYDFEFLSTEKIISHSPEGDVIVSLVKKEDAVAGPFQAILTSLKEYIQSLSTNSQRVEFITDEVSTVEIKNISRAQVKKIAQNFDIIYRIQSVRCPTIQPNRFNEPNLTWNLRFRVPANDVIIGVLDNGVRRIEPLEDIIINHRLDITNKARPNPLQATHPHGTIVASLAALGIDFFNTTRTDFTSDAYILPIKILNSGQGYFNIYEIEAAIKKAIQLGVRIFNLSVSGPGKMYNEQITEFAYLLDRLAYENDILIFIATGNLEENSIEAMKADLDAGRNRNFHRYPRHFYNPYKQSSCHVCEASNLCMPAESFNNITVGAIAENFNDDSTSDMTSFKELPAYYTRKHYYDYTKKINDTEFKRSQINYNINKPDIVMPGGDLLNRASAMQVLGFGDAGNDFYMKDAGTSLATPLAANLAARITGFYPALNMQSVKALIINSAQKSLDASFLDDVVNEIKDELARDKYGKSFDNLDKEERIKVNAKIGSEDLYRRIVGYGMPNITNALYSNSKSVTLVIQDTIAINTHKVINLNIPEYLTEYNKKNAIIHLKATLCYKFPPVWNNHLGYNPLHISFNFARSAVKNNPARTAEIIADRDNSFYNKYTRGKKTTKEINKAKKEALGIKKNLESWSEDFYPPSSKPFSNTQQLHLNITVAEIEKIDYQMALVIRCTYKRDIDRPLKQVLLNSSHEFSLAVNISETESEELEDFDLYDELDNCNSLDAISSVDIDVEGEDLEAESE